MTEVKSFIGKKGVSLGKASIFVKLALILIVIIMIVLSVNLLMKYGELLDRKAEIQTQIRNSQDSVEELEYQLESPMNKDYIVRVAREKLGLMLPEEVVYYSDISD